MPALPPLVSADWLAEHRDEVALIDVRWYPDGRSGRESYDAGHIPGAAWIDLDAYLADPPESALGRHPLPAPERFAAGMALVGISDETPVIAYDDSGGMGAGRLVWLLRALGHPAALLDGGLAAWNGPLDTSWTQPQPASFTPREWPAERLATLEEVPSLPLLVDARAPERFRGDVEPLDPRAGHIPGAVNAPWPANLDDSGRYRPADSLRETFEALGVRAGEDVVVYCGSGVTACQTLLALEAAGIDRARLYPGSWSQWCSDPDRPAALGD
jgi:thiosulfate/3-mercaptopyruvate sulfurtransferase